MIKTTFHFPQEIALTGQVEENGVDLSAIAGATMRTLLTEVREKVPAFHCKFEPGYRAYYQTANSRNDVTIFSYGIWLVRIWLELLVDIDGCNVVREAALLRSIGQVGSQQGQGLTGTNSQKAYTASSIMSNGQ